MKTPTVLNPAIRNLANRHGGAANLVVARSRRFLGSALLAALLAPWLLGAQYSMDWFTVDGGGGTSTNGQYAVAGTIGQPDAGRMSGGNFTLVGGFWGVVAAVQTEGAPWLNVTRTATNTVAIIWPLPDTGWRLQWTPDLQPANAVWTEVPPPYATAQTNCVVLEPAPAGNKFFRLHKP